MADKIVWEFKDFWGFWLIDDEYLIMNGDENGAMSGDQVEAINVSTNPNMTMYKIISVIDETKDLVESISENIKFLKWIYRKSLNWKWWYVRYSRTEKDVFIWNWDILWLKNWDKVTFSILTDEKWNKTWLLKEVVQKAWDQLKWAIDFFNDDSRIDIFKIASEEWARVVWPKEVVDEVEGLDWNIDVNEIEKREDLRELFTITIDWADSKDLDDAISIEDLWEDWYKLYVHIADVTHYVKEDWNLDIEALERATSIYLVDKVIPMLHERLSNDLCSLNPNTDKLTLTCELLIDNDWNINLEDSKVYESIINTDYRTTYKEIEELRENKIWEWNELLFWWIIDNTLVKLINNSEKLANILNINTRENGELEFDFPETKVILDNKWNPIDFKPYPKYPSNDWIKAFMVAANRTVSEKYEQTPFLHRTHLSPKTELIEKLNEILNLLETNLKISTNPNPSDFSKLLLEIEWHSKQRFLEKAILLTMQKANYTHEREWHFGLAIDYYSHFTSPIRRYPDLQIHRIIKECIHNNWELLEDRNYHYESILESVAEKSSMQQDLSVKIEREVNKLMWVKYMKDKIWEQFNWYFAWIDQRWVFVELENTITWVIRDEKRYKLNSIWEKAILFSLTDSNWDEYNVWDSVKIKVTSIDEEKMIINFDIV